MSTAFNPFTGKLQKFIKFFQVLEDTPNGYEGYGGYVLRVNSGEDALEFYAPTGTDEYVKADSTDTTVGYLSDKVDDTTIEVNVTSHVLKVKDDVFATYDHNHDDRYYTETELNTSGGGGAVHWDNVTDKPSTYPPSAHTHTKSEITDYSVEDGTATGQMLFWGGTQWTHTEISELYWEDTN